MLPTPLLCWRQHRAADTAEFGVVIVLRREDDLEGWFARDGRIATPIYYVRYLGLHGAGYTDNLAMINVLVLLILARRLWIPLYTVSAWPALVTLLLPPPALAAASRNALGAWCPYAHLHVFGRGGQKRRCREKERVGCCVSVIGGEL